MVIYYNLKESISSARKVFRLFRFFDEIKGLAKIVKSSRPKLFKTLSVYTYLCSFFYYICDNTLWFVGILLKSGAGDKALKRSLKWMKNTFSLNRIIVYLLIMFYSVVLDMRELWKDQKELLKHQGGPKSGRVHQQQLQLEKNVI